MYNTPGFTSYKEKADVIRSEFDGRAPKLRLSIFAYLIEAGVKPDDVNTTEDFVALMREVTDFVSGDVEEYAVTVSEIEDQTPEPPSTSIIELDENSPYRDNEGGYR